MKKFLGIIVIAGALVACNNSAETTETSDSPATAPLDTNTVAPLDTNTVAPLDTMKKDSVPQ